MTVKTQWLIEGRVMLSTFQGTNTEDDVQVMADDISMLLDQATGPVYHITDVSELASGKPKVDMERLKRLLKVFKDPRIACAISYGFNGNLVFKFLASTLSQLVGYRAKLANSREEALRVLSEFDSDLSLEQIATAWQDIAVA